MAYDVTVFSGVFGFVVAIVEVRRTVYMYLTFFEDGLYDLRDV